MRAVSHVEKRYSQFEKEALGVRWACEKFYLFLYGIEFEICTDHKHLVTVFSPAAKAPSACTERWLLYVQQFRFTIRSSPGKRTVRTAKEATPASPSTREVERASEVDQTLKLVRDALTSGDWTKMQGTMYKALKDELWILGQLVMRDNRIVMPHALWKRTITQAHEGHQGMTRTKARLREKVWWPQINKQVEGVIRSCHCCQLVGSRPKPERIRSTKLPDRPWSDISVDQLDIVDGEHLLVVVDYYSRWPEVVLMRNTDANSVIKGIEGVFRTHGLPETVRSDNGPPFAFEQFESFLEYLDIQHKNGVLLWSQSNGEVERFNETILTL